MKFLILHPNFFLVFYNIYSKQYIILNLKFAHLCVHVCMYLYKSQENIYIYYFITI